MKITRNAFYLLIISSNIMHAQLSGVLGKVKSTKNNPKYSAEIIERYTGYYNTLSHKEIGEELTQKREQASLKLNLDSAKEIGVYVEKNKSKYEGEEWRVDQYLQAYKEFNKNFENGALKSINDKIASPYNVQSYGIQLDQVNWFVYAKSAINSAKKVYSGTTNLDEANKRIDSKKGEYVQELIKFKMLQCEEQLSCFQKMRFSDKGNETDCIRGKDNFDSDATNNGVYIYYTGELTLHSYEIYIDGKETKASLSDSDLEDSNNGSKKSDNGWYKIQVIPGLKESNGRSTSRLGYLVKNGLTKSCEIELKNSRTGTSYKFKYNVSSYSGDINSFYKEVKGNYLKTIKPTDTKYSNAAVEKETIEAYKKHNSINPQFDIGEVKKVNVAGNDWNIYKTKLGLPDYQQTDAYFLVKGKDGNCYSDFRKIRKVYDPVTKKYGPIKVVGSDSKKEISCDLVK